MKDGKVYALGNGVHDDGDSRKNDFQIYVKVRDSADLSITINFIPKSFIHK